MSVLDSFLRDVALYSVKLVKLVKNNMKL